MSAKAYFNCLKFTSLAVFLLFLQVTAAQSRFAAVDKLLEDKKKLLGDVFGVAIVDTDTILYQKMVGDIQPRTPVAIGASSQWFTTALLLQLADEGKLSLDDPVGKYLPIFESYRRNYITLRHCLTHQTGLGKEGFKPVGFLDKKKFSSLEEEVADLLKKEIHANAGEEFRYTHYGMVIAARVVEVLTKKRFDQVIRTKLFVPAGMRNTSFTTDDGSAPNPATGAKSTAADYSRFLHLLLHKGKVGEKQILSEAAVEELRKIQVAKENTKAVPAIAQGYSFALGSWAEGNAIKGTEASMLVLPSLAGTWPLVDFSRRYGFVVVAKSFSGEQKADVYQELQKLIEQQFPVRNK